MGLPHFPLLAGFDGVAGLAKYLIAGLLDEEPGDKLIPRDKAANGVNDRHDVIDLGLFIWDNGGAGGTLVLVAVNSGCLLSPVLWAPPRGGATKGRRDEGPKTCWGPLPVIDVHPMVRRITSLPSHNTHTWMCLQRSLSGWGYSFWGKPCFRRGWQRVSQSRHVH